MLPFDTVLENIIQYDKIIDMYTTKHLTLNLLG